MNPCFLNRFLFRLKCFSKKIAPSLLPSLASVKQRMEHNGGFCVLARKMSIKIRFNAELQVLFSYQLIFMIVLLLIFFTTNLSYISNQINYCFVFYYFSPVDFRFCFLQSCPLWVLAFNYWCLLSIFYYLVRTVHTNTVHIVWRALSM